jgi:hypothetical protein
MQESRSLTVASNSIGFWIRIFSPGPPSQFQLSHDELQKDLGTFVEVYIPAQIKHENGMKSGPHPSENFLVDL